MSPRSAATYVKVYFALLVLLGLTYGLSTLDLGHLNSAVALAIAAAKALLVALYFMHLRDSPRVNALFAASGFIWLFLLFALSMADYATRG